MILIRRHSEHVFPETDFGSHAAASDGGEDDLGAIGGLMFDIGSGRYLAPPRTDDQATVAAWNADLLKVREESAAAAKARQQEVEGDATHTEIQGWLRDLGLALEFDVWIAANDRGRPYGDGNFGDRCLEALPESLVAGMDSVRLIDVIWIHREQGRVSAAFEVEHSTSIYSGIIRMLDLALGIEFGAVAPCFSWPPTIGSKMLSSNCVGRRFRECPSLASDICLIANSSSTALRSPGSAPG